MTYKEKFQASEQRAHYQNIATKILRDMSDLRSKVQDSPTAPRRWVWELIQNAKDVHNDNGVDILIEFVESGPNPKVIFSHNGKPFSADNIRFLIEQISTKDRTKDSTGRRKMTGKFGTGFLTTHLLSEVVYVKAVAKEPDLEYRQFNLVLDRSGYELNDITEAVQKAKDSIINLDELEVYKRYSDSDFNTSFNYPLLDALSIEIAKKGLIDLERCLPYSLTFVDEIKSVTIEHAEQRYCKVNSYKDKSGLEIVSVVVEDHFEEQELLFAKLSKGFTSVIVPIARKDGKIEVLSIDESVPKLFCDFPLIGTEAFPFPIIINNPNFNPTDQRDGVFLNYTQQRPNPLIDENKAVISEAIALYNQLLGHAIENKWENLYLLAKITPLKEAQYWINEHWFNESVLKPVRTKVLKAKLVRTADGSLAAILGIENKPYIWFPYVNKREVREVMWKVAKHWFPYRLPKKDEVELWYKLAWNECGRLTLDQFSAFVENKKTKGSLEKVLSQINVHQWLNDFYDLLMMDEKEYASIISKRAIVPDQNGDFWKKSQLKKDAGDIEDEFKVILKEFGNDIKAKLADPLIHLEFEKDAVIDQGYIIKEIVSEVTEKTADRDVAKGYRAAFTRLLMFFRNNPEKAKKLFPTIYRSKHLLYDDDEILANIDKAEQLEDLLKDFDVKTTEDLRALIYVGSKTEDRLLPITQDLLVSMGISNIEDWKKALEDKDLKALFAHDSMPTQDMFVIAQSLIEQAKKRVISYLETLPEYNLTLMDDQTATTVLAGVYKNSQPLSIVFRPAYDGNVIIYYGSERDTLDYEPSELWVDDGTDVRQITLGHILKTAQIRKFPI